MKCDICGTELGSKEDCYLLMVECSSLETGFTLHRQYVICGSYQKEVTSKDNLEEYFEMLRKKKAKAFGKDQ